jgi:hypothetical protein
MQIGGVADKSEYNKGVIDAKVYVVQLEGKKYIGASSEDLYDQPSTGKRTNN